MEDHEKLIQDESIAQLERDKVKISQMIDGELCLEEIKVLIEKIKTDPILRAFWKSQNLIAAILKDSHKHEWLPIDNTIIMQHHSKSETAMKKVQIDSDKEKQHRS